MQQSLPAFLQSLTIIAREGFEAILLVGAMLAVVRKAGAADRARGLWYGAAAAVAASVLTALLLEGMVSSAARVEVVEGVTMLLAAAVLFTVGHWLLARADATRWQAYVKDRVRTAAGAARSLWALAAVAFLAVYREGVETLLFYRALLAAESNQAPAILLGFVAGLALLAVLCWAIARFGVRIPVRPFFAATSALLLLLAFVFAGKGLHELQEGGVVAETAVEFVRLAPLGVYPTLETLAAQALVLLAILLPAAYTFARRQSPRPLGVGSARGRSRP
jgi:high-affinity iron transporter